MSDLEALLPEGWPRPKGYSAGVAAEGRMVFVAGLIGWDAVGVFRSLDFTDQFRQTILNTLEVLKVGGAGPQHIVRMTWYILDRAEYLAAARDLGRLWRELIGPHYPAMAVVIVAGLIEPMARIEIETTAVIPYAAPGDVPWQAPT